MTRHFYVYKNPETGQNVEAASQITAPDWELVDEYDVNYPDPGSGGSGVTVYDQLSGKPSINGVTLSGNKSNDDLKIPALTEAEKDKLAAVRITDSALSLSSENNVQNKVVASALSGKANTSDLATVAISGSYNDLSNKPTIPSAYDDSAITERVSDLETDVNDLKTNGASVTVDNTLSDTSENPVQNKVIKAALDGTVAEAIAKKQDAETGKGLSSNDYTNDEKAKLVALPTNTALQSALDGKQAVGKYVTTSADATSLSYTSGLYQLRTTLEGDGARAINIDETNKRISLHKQAAGSSTWETLATFTADEDTGWQTLNTDNASLQYRRKNGIVWVAMGSLKKAFAANANPTLAQLPTGFRPVQPAAYTVILNNTTTAFRCAVEANGNITLVNGETALTTSDTVRGSVSFPV